ncbi:MAG: DoxX family membrane protein, partial [Bacteroidales bacterium]|nr:DoxX family membrane protein [Bacteroidales bacterium]
MYSLNKTKTNVISITLFVLRTVIGWHFLYEGLVKVSTPSWSAYAYLINSKWIFAGFFNWIAETPAVLRVVDLLNVWGLVIIGLLLFFGIFTRIAAISGILLLTFYYIA